MPPQVTVALVGNPNVGKSTLFNALTGSHQHVGNWPGKTVEKKAGRMPLGAHDITVIDLPGTYSLNAYSLEEIITRDFIINEQPDLVIAVVDAANLERTLYLITQVIELSVPVLIALNMVDIAHKRDIQISPQAIEKHLGGVPVVKTVGRDTTGIAALKNTIDDLISQRRSMTATPVNYGPELEAAILSLQTTIEADPILNQQFPPRWLAIKLLENDEDLRARLNDAGYHALIAAVDQAADQIADQLGDDAETLITDCRYRFIGEIVHTAVVRPTATLETRSDKADHILTHPVWGVPLFLLLMWIVFQLTAHVSAPFLDWIEATINGPITRWAGSILDAAGLGQSWVAALVVDGVIAGVGGVLVFVPVLFFLYLAVAILEDTGYMARSAFVMDRAMRLIGLHGKSFLPLMVGFGCTVPAIYATRTLEDAEDRKFTAFLTTFMSCGARLPVYVVFGAAFFGDRAGNLIFAMYLLGIAIAILTGLAMKYTLYRHKAFQPFVLELPPYRLPTLSNVLTQVWQRTADFLRNATTIILASSIVIWFLLALPTGKNKGAFNAIRTEDSVFGAVSHAIAPVFVPAGFGSWEAAGSLITGFVAKEAVVGTMSQIYVDEAGRLTTAAEAETSLSLGTELRELVTSFGAASILTVQEIANIVPRTVNIIPGVTLAEGDWLNRATVDDTTALEHALLVEFSQVAGTPAKGKLASVAFNVFVLLYIPCMASVAAMRHEFGVRWMAYQVLYTLVLAWTAAVIVYQGGLLFMEGFHVW